MNNQPGVVYPYTPINRAPFQDTPRVQYVTTPSVPMQPQDPFVWVDGPIQAEAYRVGSGQTAVLWDSQQDSNRIYIKSTDMNGMPQPMRVLEYRDVTGQVPNRTDTTAAFVTMDEVTEMMEQKIEEMVDKKLRQRQNRPVNKKNKPRPPRREEDGYEE